MFKLLWTLIKFCFKTLFACFMILAVGALIEFIALHWLGVLLFATLSAGIYFYLKYRKRNNDHQGDELHIFPDLDAFPNKESPNVTEKKQTHQSRTALETLQKSPEPEPAPIPVLPPPDATEKSMKACPICPVEHKKDTLIYSSPLELEQALKTKKMIYSHHTKIVGVTYPNDDGTSRQDILKFCTLGESVELNQQWYAGEPAVSVIAEHGQIGYLNKELASDLYYQYFQDDDVYIHATIRSLTGGYDGQIRGCNIRIDLYKDVDEPADSPEPEVPKSQPSPKRPVVRPNPVPAAPPTKRRRRKPPVSEEDPAPEPLPGPHDRLRSHEMLDHYIVLDIETTGFSKENDRIIELAAIHYVYGVESERFCTYIDPEREIPKHITSLTGIRQSDVVNAPFISSIKSDFLRFIRDYPLVGHNIEEFDLPFLSAQLDAVIPNTTIDTLVLAREVFPELPNHKLSDVNGWLYLRDGISHRAVEDVETTNELLWACLYPEKYQDIYQAGIRNGFPEAERPVKRGCTYRRDFAPTEPILPTENVDPNSPLYGKRIVFTGEMSVSRNDAMQMAANAGAVLRTSVSGKTDYLVVGKQDPTLVGTDGLSNKQRKARDLNEAGRGHVVIIDEKEFLMMVSNSDTK